MADAVPDLEEESADTVPDLEEEESADMVPDLEQVLELLQVLELFGHWVQQD